ncbi:hypothetical protein RchiOBHm_Chr0c45g0503841 [Rosa chinensis]|uniref:Uncharacterized protein n=1 Tax=Rosa chinensis TaxID=74649 RepID=A0A2P6SPY6_ROSCH|nr:hypothetical protein RchiOBHm_Chr0c45g0503841 [Rosa chinensis]
MVRFDACLPVMDIWLWLRVGTTLFEAVEKQVLKVRWRRVVGDWVRFGPGFAVY